MSDRSSSIPSGERPTLDEMVEFFECKNNAEWNRENPELAANDPAARFVTWRCGPADANIACDCEPQKFVPLARLEQVEAERDKAYARCIELGEIVDSQRVRAEAAERALVESRDAFDTVEAAAMERERALAEVRKAGDALYEAHHRRRYDKAAAQAWERGQ